MEPEEYDYSVDDDFHFGDLEPEDSVDGDDLYG